MLKKQLVSVLVGGVLLAAGSVGIAAPASADDSIRTANCTLIGGAFVNDSNDAKDRCIVVTRGTSTTINGTTETSPPEVRNIGDVYAGDSTFVLLEEETVTTYETVYGTWSAPVITNGAVISGTCTTTGKNRGSVQKCEYEKISTTTRTNVTTATTTTPVVEVTQQFQDTETFVTDTTPTTVRTPITTVSHSFKNDDTLATRPAPTTTNTTESVAGTPIEEERIVATETVELDPIKESVDPTVDNGGIVVSEPVEVVEEQVVVTPTECKMNKSKSTDRENACPTP